MKTADIYIITNLINNKQYVGQTVKGYLTRFEGHCRLYNRCKLHNIKYPYKTHIDEAIAYYGVENFKVELLEVVPYELKYEKEIYYINKYNTYKKGYNYTIGGDINPMYSEKTKQYHKQTMSRPEIRQKISKSVKNAYTQELREWFSQHSKNIWNNWSEQQKENCIKRYKGI